MVKLLSIPLSLIYGMVTSLRNTLYDLKVKKSVEFDVPIVCVGNIAVGGTGKTPHTEMMVNLLKSEYNIAILSRGYKRKTKGYRVVQTSSLVKQVGDEPKQMKIRFPDVNVVVCESRVEGIERLRKDFPDTNLVLLDDGYQHRHVETWLNVLLTEHDRPIYTDHLLPWGRLRESLHAMSRAQVVIVTKTPQDIKPIDLRLITKRLSLFPYQTLFFTYMAQRPPVPVFGGEVMRVPRSGASVVAMSSIASHSGFVGQLESQSGFKVVDHISFPDHHNLKMNDINLIVRLLEKYPELPLLVTEKDAVKFMSSKKIPLIIRQRMFKVPIEVRFLNTDLTRKNTKQHFIDAIMPYVRKNHKHHCLHI